MKETFLWLFQRVTGAFLLVGLFVHFYTMHYTGADAIGHEAVIARLSNPWWVAFDLMLLISIAFHGLNGMWGMAVEYIHKGGALMAAKGLILITGVGVVATGTYILTF